MKKLSKIIKQFFCDKFLCSIGFHNYTYKMSQTLTGWGYGEGYCKRCGKYHSYIY